MPEYPDVQLYRHALARHVEGARLTRATIAGPNLMRSFDPPLASLHGQRLLSTDRLGKRIILHFEDDLHLVLHLMISGRLQWTPLDAKPARRLAQAWFDFDRGRLVLTEASTRKRAHLHLLRGTDGLGAHDPGGLEVLEADFETFHAALTGARHTLKRALTDPRLFSGIGNAYSDEILHRARLSPFLRTQTVTTEQSHALYDACHAVLREWEQRLVEDFADEWPRKVTAFREGMAVHGRFGKPCPDCGTKVQRIRHKSNETNYCAQCQTEGRLLADRGLSRLLREDWPRSLDELEERDPGSK